MTHNQIDYQKYVEDKRHNVAAEMELNRNNVASINEAIRNNTGVLGENIRHNKQYESETNRHNVITERVSNDQNLINAKHYNNQDIANSLGVSENVRHNQASEGISAFQASTDANYKGIMSRNDTSKTDSVVYRNLVDTKNSTLQTKSNVNKNVAQTALYNAQKWGTYADIGINAANQVLGAAKIAAAFAK